MTLRLTVEEVALVLADQGRLTSPELAAEARICRRLADYTIARLLADDSIVRDTTPSPGYGQGRGKRARRYVRAEMS